MVLDCKFLNTTSENGHSGSGINVINSLLDLSIINSTFFHNTFGGAIVIDSAVVQVLMAMLHRMEEL